MDSRGSFGNYEQVPRASLILTPLFDRTPDVKLLVINFARLPQAFHPSSRDDLHFVEEISFTLHESTPNAFPLELTGIPRRHSVLEHFKSRKLMSRLAWHYLPISTTRPCALAVSTMILWKPTSAIRIIFQQARGIAQFPSPPRRPTPTENSFLMR